MHPAGGELVFARAALSTVPSSVAFSIAWATGNAERLAGLSVRGEGGGRRDHKSSADLTRGTPVVRHHPRTSAVRRSPISCLVDA